MATAKESLKSRIKKMIPLPTIKKAKSKKAAPARKKKRAAKKPAQGPALNNPNDVNPMMGVDRAHSPGHRKMNLKNEFAESSGEKVQLQKSALDRFAPADKINRETAQIRINGSIRSGGQRRRSSKADH